MGSSSPPLGLLMRPPNPTISLSSSSSSSSSSLSLGLPSTSQNPSFLCSSLNPPSTRRWVGAKIAPWGQTTLNSRYWVSPLSLSRLWLRGYMRRGRAKIIARNYSADGAFVFGPDEENGTQVPTQAQSVVEGSGAVLVSEYKPIPDIDYLQELLAIQQQGPRAIGFFGTRNMGFMHQQLIEILSYAMVITKNHIFTSGASGTNAAVIRGALRAEKPELLTVILPQSLKKQPPESQELLSKVVQHGHNLEGAAGHMLRVSRQQIAHGNMPGSEESSQNSYSFLLGLAFKNTWVSIHFCSQPSKSGSFTSLASLFLAPIRKPSQADLRPILCRRKKCRNSSLFSFLEQHMLDPMLLIAIGFSAKFYSPSWLNDFMFAF